MEIVLNNKTYVMPKVKTRMLRKAIEINENIDFSNMKTKDLDGLVDFIVDLYGNKFSRDNFYDGLDADKLIETLNNSINGIVGNLGNKLKEFPNK
ncbi:MULTISPECIES: phage tail assembly chaperone G [Clostridium]|uniref:Phage tail assembly chaperone G n=1 Tax=Clostridium lapidicellarium TaxID=3240931 RepID=A0ABV4DTA7_9CLOT